MKAPSAKQQRLDTIQRAAESIAQIENLLGGLGSFGWTVMCSGVGHKKLYYVRLQIGVRSVVSAEGNTLTAATLSAIRQVYEAREKEAVYRTGDLFETGATCAAKPDAA
jgi:hypothetical protein